jgi:hypothetical protein
LGKTASGKRRKGEQIECFFHVDFEDWVQVLTKNIDNQIDGLMFLAGSIFQKKFAHRITNTSLLKLTLKRTQNPVGRPR